MTPLANAHGSEDPSVAAQESDGENDTQWSLLIGFGILDFQYPSPSQILGIFSRFSEDFLGRERERERDSRDDPLVSGRIP